MKYRIIFLCTIILFIFIFSVIKISACTPNWHCSPWTSCNSSFDVQKRTCKDTNQCNDNSTKPIEKQDCINCNENWKCNSWSDCINGIKTRDCYELNSCGTIENKPNETSVCNQEIVENNNNNNNNNNNTVGTNESINLTNNKTVVKNPNIQKNLYPSIIFFGSITLILIIIFLILIVYLRKKK